MRNYFFFISLIYGVLVMNSVQAKNYHYMIDVGASPEYEMVYDFNQNYFFDRKNKPLLYFTVVGGPPSSTWAQGTQATSLSEYLHLPKGIHVRWFSVAENQFWQADYSFDQHLLEKLSRYTVDNIIHRSKIPFMKHFSFTVYTVPGGLVTVWISGGGEIYLLGQFQAQKVDEPDWDSFAKAVLQRRKLISREDYIKERFSDPNSAMSTLTKTVLTESKAFSSFPWKRLMYTYDWSLTVSNNFILKDYWTWYMNGEKRFSYTTDRHSPPRAVPYFISFYVERNDTKKELERINIDFDKTEIMLAFEKLAQLDLLDNPIELRLDIPSDLKQVEAFLIRGSHSVELKNISPSLEDLYNN